MATKSSALKASCLGKEPTPPVCIGHVLFLAGTREPIVLEGRLVCADAARLDGRTGEAKEQYQHVAEDGEPSERLVLEARLGVAECLMPEGNFAGAFSGWRAVVHSLPLAAVSDRDRLTSRCREVAVELAESGYRAEVTDLLAQLPQP
ncbi:hypothetical protein [Streptomyces tibetensis]|uniref:hypothetical protein n=1 Tax=Streptomyces tibetensis TaxID=2382123 RepID=UPI0033F17606